MPVEPLTHATTIHSIWQAHVAQHEAMATQEAQANAAGQFLGIPTQGYGNTTLDTAPTVEIFDEMGELFSPALATNPLYNSLTKKHMREAKPPENKTTLLQDVFKYPALKLDKVRSNAYEKGHKLPENPFQWITTNAIVGVEVEVENIRHVVNIEAYWQAKQDNSLRNNGVEYVSIPLAVKQIEPAIKHLYDALRKNNTPDFSNRTSTHIHLNCRDMTQEQIYTMFLLYCIFERHFFKMVGTKRLNSIFCVPVFRSNLDNKAVRTIYNLEPVWQKYCAINLLPLTSNTLNPGGYGTVEFRHLYGCADEKVVMEWIDNILALRKAAMEITLTDLSQMIQEMNTSSSYKSLYAQVFPEKYRILIYKKEFEDCISNIKREMFGDDYKNEIRVSSESQYWNIAAKLGMRG
jgi:hypothetical protein